MLGIMKRFCSSLYCLLQRTRASIHIRIVRGVVKWHFCAENRKSMGYNHGSPIRASLVIMTISVHSRTPGNSWPRFDQLQNICVWGLESIQNHVPCKTVFGCLRLNVHKTNPVSHSLKDIAVSW